ncbi:MAG: hypothetical protein KKF06_02615 [Candidatus Margulisbacteria bacterium]|nr:hypothetical protein [Candidatus Margulisiibacteriota bacterium]
MRKFWLLLLWVSLSLPLVAVVFSTDGIPSQLATENDPKLQYLYRVKIVNVAGGSIEVSLDAQKRWQLIGHVLYPTTRVNRDGYAASRWVGDGEVAATAVNAIHVKTSNDEKSGKGIIFSLLPKEQLRPPKAYDSYLSPDSSIYTDIPAGTELFGGGSAPFVGNRVFFSRQSDYLYPITPDYQPAIGDVFTIMVKRPADYPTEIDFENNFGGKITIKYLGGRNRTIATVLRPVVGVGRFEGTVYASTGRIRANHAGVIDVSTSPLGEIGGFQMVPAEHGSELKYVREKTQWLVIGPPLVGSGSLEGIAPFFRYFIQPSYRASDIFDDENWEKKLLSRFLVEVKYTGEENWQAMPSLSLDRNKSLPKWADTALDKVSDIRILFPITGQ